MNTNQEENQMEEGPSGIGGWLILVALGLIFKIIKVVIYAATFKTSLAQIMSMIDEMPNLNALKPLMYAELMGNCLFALYAVVLLILMFHYSKLFPRLMIIFYASNLFFLIADSVAMSQIASRNLILNQIVQSSGFSKEMAVTIIGAIIWIPYMMVSKRVKNTFTE